jgi:hypothetical protein
MERIALAREYRVEDWLRNAYLELTQRQSLDFDSEELRPAAEPYSNGESDTRDWEAEAKRWEAVSRGWETLARISQLQKKAVLPADVTDFYCDQCFGHAYPGGPLCDCQILDVVNETFRGEFESLKENPDHVDPPLPCKLSKIIIIFYFVEKKILYS